MDEPYISWLAVRNPDCGRDAIEALVARGRTVVPRLLTCLSTGDPLVCCRVAEVLGRIGRPAVPYLLPALTAPDWPTRRVAAVALGKIGAPEAIESLLPLLDDREKSVRRAAKAALVRIGEPALPPLQEMLQATQRHPPVRALLALKALLGPAAIPTLLAALTAMQRGLPGYRPFPGNGLAFDRSYCLVRQAIVGQGKNAVPWLGTALEQALALSDTHAVSLLLDLLTECRDMTALPYLIRASRSSVGPCARMAAESLRFFPHPDALRCLTDLLQAQSLEVRQVALQSINLQLLLSIPVLLEATGLASSLSPESGVLSVEYECLKLATRIQDDPMPPDFYRVAAEIPCSYRRIPGAAAIRFTRKLLAGLSRAERSELGGQALMWRKEEAPSHLLAQLNAPEGAIRALALYGVGLLREIRAVPVLLQLATRERHRDRRDFSAPAIWALGAIASADRLPRLVLATPTLSLEARLESLRAMQNTRLSFGAGKRAGIYQFPLADLRSYCREMLEDRDPVVRHNAAEILECLLSHPELAGKQPPRQPVLQRWLRQFVGKPRR